MSVTGGVAHADELRDGSTNVSEVVIPIVAGSRLVAYSPNGQAFRMDTGVLRGSSLRAWWIDPRSGTVIDTGSVRRGPAVAFFPPQTGAADAGLSWLLIIDDVGR